MSVHVLVDTSVWSLALRRKPRDLAPAEAAIAAELSELVTAGRARLIGVVRQELLSGIKTPEQYERLRKALRAYSDEAINVDDFEAAAKASNDCRVQGISGSAVDFLICAMALRREWAIFSTDPDFQRYAKALPLKMHVAPAAEA
jgi:predicted nucleic acid-binding protein